MTSDHLCILLVYFLTMASGNLRNMPEVKDMAIANSRFMLSFLNGTEQKSDNIIFAPYSISTALAMTCKGAKGDTAKEMKSVLKWASEDVPTSGFGQYLTLLQEAAGINTSGYILVGAQRIYVDGKLSVKPDFSTDIQKHFVSDAQQADFANNSDGERVNINTWVSEQTRGKINDLLPSGSITPLTAMVLLQATYFKGNWMHKFDAANTREADFHSPKGTVRVNMMRQTTKFHYVHWEKLGCAAVELPYASNNADSSSHDLSMLILLPDARDGLERLESSLTYEKLQEIRGSLRSVKVMIW